uniref:Uncharacterized protein n=1 Tax=Anopheles funestus TaxID=62324 RepID=A0A4Y0BGH9_ANOFN
MGLPFGTSGLGTGGNVNPTVSAKGWLAQRKTSSEIRSTGKTKPKQQNPPVFFQTKQQKKVRKSRHCLLVFLVIISHPIASPLVTGGQKFVTPPTFC